ncbi:MAG: hypothetical protein AAB116_04280 [Candidatus Poribacteria bacterium]
MSSNLATKFAVVDEEWRFMDMPGRIDISIGGGQPGFADVVSGSFRVVGQATRVD